MMIGSSSGRLRRPIPNRPTCDGGAGLVLAGGGDDAVGQAVRRLRRDLAVVGLVAFNARIQRRAVGQRTHYGHGHSLREEHGDHEHIQVLGDSLLRLCSVASVKCGRREKARFCQEPLCSSG